MVKIKRQDGTEFNYRDIIEDDPDDRYFLQILNEFAPYTMTVFRGIEPAYSLYKAVQYLVGNKIPGDFVECGVWRGGSVILVALALAHFGDTDRKIYLYDTFEGMTRPEKQDVDWDGNDLLKKWERDSAQKRIPGGDTAVASRRSVKRFTRQTIPRTILFSSRDPSKTPFPALYLKKSPCCAWIRTGILLRIMSLSICIRS